MPRLQWVCAVPAILAAVGLMSVTPVSSGCSQPLHKQTHEAYGHRPAQPLPPSRSAFPNSSRPSAAIAHSSCTSVFGGTLMPHEGHLAVSGLPLCAFGAITHSHAAEANGPVCGHGGQPGHHRPSTTRLRSSSLTFLPTLAVGHFCPSATLRGPWILKLPHEVRCDRLPCPLTSLVTLAESPQ